MRVLPTPDAHEFSLDAAGPRETVVGIVLAELVVVDVVGKEPGCGQHIRFIAARKARWPPRQMPMTPSRPVQHSCCAMKSRPARASLSKAETSLVILRSLPRSVPAGS